MKTWQRRTAVGIGSVVGLFVLVLGGVYGMSARAIGGGHEAEAHPFDASAGNADEGRRLANMYGCVECHGPDLGGQVIVDDMPFGRVASANLTAGREGGPLTDAQFEQAVRHGIGSDGTKLFIMPSAEYTYFSDQDMADIKAYINTLAPVQRDLPRRTFGPVGRALVTLGQLPFQPDIIANDPDARHLEKPGVDQPEQLGYYLTRLCIGCHGPQLAGGVVEGPGGPPSANLTPAGNLKNWSLEDFRTVMRTGTTPEGKQLDPAVMPWRVIGQASPAEIEAVWTYLRTLEPIQTPSPE